MSNFSGDSSMQEPIIATAVNSSSNQRAVVSGRVIVAILDENLIENCKLPHNAIYKISYYYYFLLILLFGHFSLSMYILIRSSGYLAAGLWVPIMVMILFYLLARYPGFIYHDMFSNATENPNDPVYRIDNPIRLSNLRMKYYVSIILIIAAFSSIISESVKLSILNSFDSCAFDGSSGDVCSPTLNCYGDSEYYLYSVNCYVQNFGANNSNGSGYEDCSCMSSNDVYSCYNFSNVYSCSDFMTALPTAEIFIVLFDTLIFIVSIYFTYILYNCLYYPASFIKNPVVSNVVNDNREPVFTNAVSYA